MKQGLVFDLDGTLVDSLPGIACGLNGALESLGMPTHTEEAIRMMVGSGARELCKSALAPGCRGDVPDQSIADLLAAFMRIYPDTWQDGTHIYPGINDLLGDLNREGRPLAVLSNKPHAVTAPLVRALFPDIRFDSVMGYSDRFPRKPDPAALLSIAGQWKLPARDVTMIGDSIHDAGAAQAAGSGLLLVGWGYGNRTALEGCHAPVCDTVDELRGRLDT